jgi:hypothetical protein
MAIYSIVVGLFQPTNEKLINGHAANTLYPTGP